MLLFGIHAFYIELRMNWNEKFIPSFWDCHLPMHNPETVSWCAQHSVAICSTAIMINQVWCILAKIGTRYQFLLVLSHCVSHCLCLIFWYFGAQFAQGNNVSQADRCGSICLCVCIHVLFTCIAHVVFILTIILYTVLYFCVCYVFPISLYLDKWSFYIISVKWCSFKEILRGLLGDYFHFPKLQLSTSVRYLFTECVSIYADSLLKLFIWCITIHD